MSDAVTPAGSTEPGEPRESYRISDDPDQVRREQERLHVLARVIDPITEEVLGTLGIGPGWQCCDVGSGAGTIAAWMAGRVGHDGRIVSIDVDTRFQPPSSGIVEVRQADVTSEPIGEAAFDLVHARGVLQHVEQREAVLDAMVGAAKPGGWVVVTDVDWIQFDAQPVPEPFATLSRTLRDLSERQHGYDASWGRRLLDAFRRRGLREVDARVDAWTMHGGTDSAEWYVGALERALAVLPGDLFRPGFVPAEAIAQARDPQFTILSPLSVTAWGRR